MGPLLATLGPLALKGAIWAAENYGPQLLASWLKSKQTPPSPVNPVDGALGTVRAETVAVQKVDPSGKAIANDPSNLGPVR